MAQACSDASAVRHCVFPKPSLDPAHKPANAARNQSSRNSARALPGAVFAVALALTFQPPHAAGQSSAGFSDAFVTRFSGTRAEGGANIIDVDGAVGSLMRLQTMGSRPRGAVVPDPPADYSVTAGQVGQVLGIAIDDNQPANIYLTATSAFGLHRTADGSGWMAGQWGPGGGSGSIWVLEAANNYAPRLFANVALEGRANTGAGLGNIAYDRWHKQLLVSDLETGMIHRFRTSDGADLSRYDHGMNGRGAFSDAASGAAQTLPPLAFDRASRARIGDCPSGSFASHASCWNLADFRRRPYGLGVHRLAATGEVRLYYALWSSDGFGAADWFAAGDERRNTIWSIRLGDDGDFDLGSVRREATIPDMFADPVAVAGKGFSRPVSDIAFPACGGGDVMLLAERGGVRNLGLGAPAPFAYPHESRVLRFRRDGNGVWQSDGRIDVGFADRKSQGQPYLRANAAGGVSFGPGYDEGGTALNSRLNGSIWATGDALCSADGPCFAPDAGNESNEGPVHGAQGSPADVSDALMPAAAREPYPATGHATPPQTPRRSYILGGDGTLDVADATMVGDIEVIQPCAGERTDAAPERAVPDGGRRQGLDLAIEKTGTERCMRGGPCNYTITITNRGDETYAGAIVFSEDMINELMPVTFAETPPWSCHNGDGYAICRHEPVTLEPGQSVSATLRGTIDPANTDAELTNCAAISWPLATQNAFQANFLAEKALADLNDPRYPTGPVDGLVDAAMDPITHDSILAYQTDNGLDPTGTVTPELLQKLYPGSASREGDVNPDNDGDCHTVQLIAPFDLELAKGMAMGMGCGPGEPCTFYLDTHNIGPGAYVGPLALRDTFGAGSPFGMSTYPLGFVSISSLAWSCASDASDISCRGNVSLPPWLGWEYLNLHTQIPATIPAGTAHFRNCATIDWPAMGLSGDINSANDDSCAFWVIGAMPAMLDLGIFGGTQCTLGETCRPTVMIRNVGKEPYTASVGFKGKLHANVGITRVDGWKDCETSGNTYSCPAQRLALKPGEEIVATLPFELPSTFPGRRIINTFEMQWSEGKEQDKNAINDKGQSVITIVDARKPEPTPQPTPTPEPLPIVPPSCDSGWTQYALGTKPPRGWETKPLRQRGRIIATCARQPSCPSNQVFASGQCRCPDARPNWNGKLCVACPCNQVWSASSNRCTCPGGTFPVGECCRSCPDGQRYNARKSICECPSQTPHWTGSQCVSCAKGSEWNAARRRCEEIAVKPRCDRGLLVKPAGEWVCKCEQCATRVTTGRNAYACKPAIQCANGTVHWRGNRPVCSCGRGLKLEGSGCSFRCVKQEALPTCDKGYEQVSAAKARALKRRGYDIRTERGRGGTIYCARAPQARPRPTPNVTPSPNVTPRPTPNVTPAVKPKAEPQRLTCINGRQRGNRCVCSGGRRAVAVPGKANTYRCR